MNQTTTTQLNALNTAFYAAVHASFNDTRQLPWDGWLKLTHSFDFNKCNSILDLGCGNGRFYDFATSQGFAGSYLGIDNSKELLHYAAKRYGSDRFRQSDILDVDSWNLNQKYDLIVLFGVMHHVPGGKNRQNIVNAAAAALNPAGKLVFSTWNFAQSGRYAKRFAGWESIGLQSTDVEQGDYLLDWQRGANALRYCHSYTTDEVQNLLAGAELKLELNFSADGRNEEMNDYWVCGA